MQTTDQATPKQLVTYYALGAGAITAVLFCVGSLIENIYFAIANIPSAPVIEARAIFVGLAFVVFLLVPPAIILPGVFLGKWIVRLAEIRSRWLASGVTVLSVALMLPGTLSVIAAPLHYFTSYSADLGGSVFDSPRAMFYLYNQSIVLAAVFVLLASGATLGACSMWLAKQSARHSVLRLSVIATLLGAVMAPVPYCEVVYPNIPVSMGGGQPRIAALHMQSPSDKPPKWFPSLPGDEELLSFARHGVDNNILVAILADRDDHILIRPILKRGNAGSGILINPVVKIYKHRIAAIEYSTHYVLYSRLAANAIPASPSAYWGGIGGFPESMLDVARLNDAIENLLHQIRNIEGLVQDANADVEAPASEVSDSSGD